MADSATDPADLDEDYVPSGEELSNMLKVVRRPGVLLMKTPYSDDPGVPGSWFGGEPTLPPEIEWPVHKVCSEDGQVISEIPMHFLVQINLATLPLPEGVPELPQTGTLFFFFEPIFCNNFGIAPDCGRVIYVEEDVSECPTRSMPKIPPLSELPDWANKYAEKMRKYGRNDLGRGFRRWSFDYFFFTGYRSGQFRNRVFRDYVDTLSINISKDIKEMVSDRCDLPGPNAIKDLDYTYHHIFGSNGGFEPEESYETENPWVRLLAVKDDLDLGFRNHTNWVVFWIKNEDLEARKFENAFTVEEFQ